MPIMIQRNVPGIGPWVLPAFALAAVPALLAALAYAMLARRDAARRRELPVREPGAQSLPRLRGVVQRSGSGSASPSAWCRT
ncbi:MAG: hypothetical protein MZV64_21625 [Ignavibacteriales bacterium]|nr:hypothetical protein [Ignavibacteriales bacterium]